tara:strand:+ start:1065 stop:1454 length:390 start_codon:yes stop_codon:yes gene_type:complete
MKSITTILTCLLITIVSGVSFSQVEKKTIKKEVRMEVVNGKKVLTIESTIDGKVTTETFTGAEAEAKMGELQKNEKMNLKGEKKEVKVEKVDGKTTLTITTTSKGKESVEVYTGAEAEKRIKEMEGKEN